MVFPQKAMNVLETILDESMSERKPMCITSDGKRIFLGGNIDNSVRVYSGDPNGCRLECMRKVHGNVTSLALACDDQILVIGSDDSTVSLWLVKYPSKKTNLDNIREGLRDNIAMMRVEANSIFNEGSTVLKLFIAENSRRSEITSTRLRVMMLILSVQNQFDIIADTVRE